MLKNLSVATLWFATLTLAKDDDTVRVATFNLSLNRFNAGDLETELCATPAESAQAKTNAEIIQRVQPDILFLNEFDYDEDGAALA